MMEGSTGFPPLNIKQETDGKIFGLMNDLISIMLYLPCFELCSSMLKYNWLSNIWSFLKAKIIDGFYQSTKSENTENIRNFFLSLYLAVYIIYSSASKYPSSSNEKSREKT